MQQNERVVVSADQNLQELLKIESALGQQVPNLKSAIEAKVCLHIVSVPSLWTATADAVGEI